MGKHAQPTRAFEYTELRFERAGGIEIAEMPVIGRVNRVRHDVLSQMEKRSQITTDQWTAGELFATDYQLAGMDMMQAGSMAPTIPGYDLGKDEVRQRAAVRFRGALKRLGTVGGSLAVWVCCENRTASDWAHKRGVSREYGTDRLREALDELSEFYGVPVDADAAP